MHLAVCQATVPWECVLDLVERGAQISLKNRAGVTAADLAPSCLLARLQDQMLSDCWSGLGAGSSALGTMIPLGLEPSGNSNASGPSVSASATAARSSNPARILRKLRTASGATAVGPAAIRMESTEEASSASVEMLALSSTGSVRSRASKGSLDAGASGNNNNNNKVRHMNYNIFNQACQFYSLQIQWYTFFAAQKPINIHDRFLERKIWNSLAYPL